MFVYRLHRAIQKRVFIPFLVNISIIRFFIKKFFWGFTNANQYLTNIDKRAIIPLLRRNGASIGNNCDIETGITFHNCQDYKKFKVGNNCHIGKNCFFDLRDKIIIHDNVVVSMKVTFITHIDMSKSELTTLFPQQQKEIIIRSNTYIGANATLLMGIETGEKSFIAASSLIKENVPPHTVVGGVPSKIIKKLI